MVLASAKVGIDAHVPWRPAQGLPLTIRYMLFGFRIAILLGRAEIDDVNDLMKP